MATIINKLTKDFTTLPNALIQDDTLSDRARFLFVYMATKPSDWQFFQKPLCRGLGWSADTLRKYMSELIDAGWVSFEGQRLDKGKFTANQYTLHSFPTREKTVSENFRHGKKPTLTKERNIQKKDSYKKESESTRTHENSHTLKDNSKTSPIPAAPPSLEDVDYIEVAKQMADYFENDERGKTEWQWMCSTKRVKVKPLAITGQWAAKHQDAPYMLQNWRKHTGKLINWIREQNDTGKHTGTNQPATTYEAPRTAHRPTKRKKISKEELAEIQKLTKNAKFSN